jgi:hypothetical protein
VGKGCDCDWTTLCSHVGELFSSCSSRFPVNEETFFSKVGLRSTPQEFNHVISRYGDIIWPARSPNLSACDFFLWEYLKSQVFKVPAPHRVQELKHRIQEEVERIPIEMLRRVMSDFRKRLTECLKRNCGHVMDVIFGK